jgi:antitoxin (DNA-binding transcriptional repressor) of toxin-antitoxin stability system
MKKKTAISVTEAARNFAECVNLVRYRNFTFVLLKNGSPVARLSPPEEKVCRGSDLAEVLARVKLSREEAVAWNRDLKRARKSLRMPASKWE